MSLSYFNVLIYFYSPDAVFSGTFAINQNIFLFELTNQSPDLVDCQRHLFSHGGESDRGCFGDYRQQPTLRVRQVEFRNFFVVGDGFFVVFFVVGDGFFVVSGRFFVVSGRFFVVFGRFFVVFGRFFVVFGRFFVV